MAGMLRWLLVFICASPLVGCGPWPGNSAPAGVVTGLVTYGGLPAAGKVVTLVGADVRTVTDAAGRYTFQQVPAKQVQVLYASQGDLSIAHGDGLDVLPNEVQTWRSRPLDLADGSGREVPSFEVAYNGLLYPDRILPVVVSEKVLLPFHFSVHPQGQKYRVRLLAPNSRQEVWSSNWASEPTAVFGKTLTPGAYRWIVDIDGGDRGSGTTRDREVHLSGG
jgi:hypothetical protein